MSSLLKAILFGDYTNLICCGEDLGDVLDPAGKELNTFKNCPSSSKISIRIITRTSYTEPTNSLFLKLKLLTFGDLVDFKILQPMFKIKNQQFIKHYPKNIFSVKGEEVQFKRNEYVCQASCENKYQTSLYVCKRGPVVENRGKTCGKGTTKN